MAAIDLTENTVGNTHRLNPYTADMHRADLYRRTGNYSQAAELYVKQGDFFQALDAAKQSKDPEVIAGVCKAGISHYKSRADDSMWQPSHTAYKAKEGVFDYELTMLELQRN
ncbi:hypothetical protein KY362_01545 [Candidatus Woesearchaeota archaeon]|nr:hypothetical protein [Candidatus Woesearchaeota archaeon]